VVCYEVLSLDMFGRTEVNHGKAFEAAVRASIRTVYLPNINHVHRFVHNVSFMYRY
jgi:hypothetical protein